MKKLIVAILLICICLNLCACGKSEEAQNVDDLILSIGEVTLGSSITISNAREEYERLSDKQKQQVENYHILEDAIGTLSILEAEQARIEAEQARIEANYLKIYNWMVENGKPIIDTSINNYGEVIQYEYVFISNGQFPIRFTRIDDGKLTASTYLSFFHSTSPRDFDSNLGNLYEQNATILIYPVALNLAYAWNYAGLNVYTSRKFELASGYVDVKDISQLSSSGTNYVIEDYTEVDNFRSLSGYTDVRKEINNELIVTLDLFEEFLTKKVGLSMTDIGFSSYS